jgi:hypothetical protein
MIVAEPRAPESVATPVRRSTRTIAESVDVNATGTCDMVLSLESITTAVNVTCWPIVPVKPMGEISIDAASAPRPV